MNAEYISIKDVPKTHRRAPRAEQVEAVKQLIKDGREAMVFHCESRKDVNSLYQTLYSSNIRRHNTGVSFTRRDTDLYVINLNAVKEV